MIVAEIRLAKAAVVRVDVKLDGTVVVQYNLGIPIDVDDDGISDKWEREQVASWNTQFGESQTEDFEFFLAEDDKEEVDPDGTDTPSNPTDGGIDMPLHAAAGDSLTVLQEYRGFILDGGAGHTGRHKRLSASKKELLVEVDIMAGVTNMPSEAGIRGIMDTVSSGFGNLTTGAGVDLYYVIDETAAAHEVFPRLDADDWANEHRRKTDGSTNMLSEFIYLAFVDSLSDAPDWIGGAGGCGSMVFVDRLYPLWNSIAPPKNSFSAWSAYVAAHELTHNIIPKGCGDDKDLIPAPDPYDSDNDKQHLMYDVVGEPHSQGHSGDFIRFSDKTRGMIDLTNKNSVERYE